MATTRWCPYTCGNEQYEFGVIGSYLKELLAKQNISLKINYYPWSRAVRLAQSGDVNGLLTATHEEAPGLMFTESPVSHYQMCFYTKKENNWQYQEPISLDDNSLMVVQDYSYGEPLDSFIKESDEVVNISGQETTKRLLELLSIGRVDIIVEDPAVVNWVSRRELIEIKQFNKAGCLPKKLFYFALTPSKHHKKIIDKLNQQLIKPENLKLLKALVLAIK